LTVRANDGSNFSFDDTSIIFKLDGSDVCTAIRDSGTENGYRKWMRPYGRTVPRDEFGRESTLDVSDPTKYSGATARTEGRLNEALGKHSLFVQKFTTPKPVFNDAYEKAIESRNGLENEKTVIKSNLDNAETTRSRQIAEVNQTKNKELQVSRAALESALATATAAQASQKRVADTRLIQASGEGQAALSGKIAEAKQLQGQLDAMYLQKAAEINAFRTQPTERVMEVLGEKLKGVTIHVQPYADDATPTAVDLRNK
jgi:membrane protease subunit HflC